MLMPQTTMTVPFTDKEKHIWVVGMEVDEPMAMLHTLSSGVRLEHKTVNQLTDNFPDIHQGACLTLITLKAWSDMTDSQRKTVTGRKNCKMILVLEKDDQHIKCDIEQVVSQNFLDAIRLPLTTEKLEKCCQKAHEIFSVYDDIYTMTNEIILERELLARKNEQLDFLNKILTKASKSLNPGTIINQAGRDLNILLEVESIMGIFWNPEAPAFLSAEIFIPPNLDDTMHEQWVGHLLDQAERHARNAVKSYQVEILKHDESLFHPIDLPDSGTTIQLPLIWNERTFGILFMVSREAELLGRDRVKVLQAVANHLALALRNALLYRQMQNQADHDGLTRIFNRQNFERRIVKELKRHQRYQNELSLLMLDLDHFKQINDDYGHLAGDMVLREVADILRTTLRECDFPARFGGEEFVVILPHTEEENAWILAERIRKKIAAHTFKFHEHYFQVTTSIGISSIKPSLLKPADYLIHLADQALYRAKTSGRNMVCRSAPPEKDDLCVNDSQRA
ncbi:GGDEF domain-containing protein [Desulfoplanes sp. PS50]|jgi:diguanylate cyclase (GGDEF)-like protein